MEHKEGRIPCMISGYMMIIKSMLLYKHETLVRNFNNFMVIQSNYRMWECGKLKSNNK